MKMNQYLPLLAVVALAFGAESGRAQAPLEVAGISDRSYNSYDYQVTFSVPSVTGYSYHATLDGNPVPTDVAVTVNKVEYHEVSVWRTNLQSGIVTNRLVRFIVVDPTRNGSENGIPPWTPYPTVNSAAAEFAGAHLRLIAPQDFPTGYPIPVVAWVENEQEHAVRVNGLLTADGQASIQIKRGVGSGFLASTNPAGALTYSPEAGGLTDSRTINLEASTTWTIVTGGTLPADTTWTDNSRIRIMGNVTNPPNSTLTIGAGSIVIVNPSVDFGNNGNIVINGTRSQPVVFMPFSPSQPWGGFVQHANNASFTATGTIFTGSGADQGCWFTGHGCGSSVSGIGSHRGEQALISLRGQNCNLTLSDCAAMYLAGQFGHSASGSYSYQITLTHFLMQRVTTGGEYTGAKFTVNDSAFIECNEDLSAGEFPNFVDGDNDALYIVNAPLGPHGFTNTLFGWTTDDGVDSGGSGSGVLNWQNCWFDSIYHEGNSLSGTGKDSRHYGDVFLNCGQGIEDGYDGPTGRVDHCLILGNVIGVRFGDNYANYSYNGFQWATNCSIINNYRDVWGMNWQSGSSGWIYRASQMNVQSNFLSAPNPFHPDNYLWDPATDAWRLTNFMTTPPDASVGLGLAVWTPQFSMSKIFDGVPTRLSSFTTNFVSVDYTFENDNGSLASGTLTFAPGETLKRIYPAGFDASAQSQVRLVLHDPNHAELTGETNVTFVGSVASPQISLRVGSGELGRQMDLARVGEGLAVGLNTPSSEAVSIHYQVDRAGGVVADGVLTFEPGQTLQWINLPGVDPSEYNLLRLTLSDPSWAQLAGSSNYFLVKTAPVSEPPAPVTLIQNGSTWRYLDTGANLGAAWSPSNLGGWTGPNFSDGSWLAGTAPLGYGDANGRVPTTILRWGSSSSNKHLTYYFRYAFFVTNAARITSLTFNLMRDDGAVVYLNGPELYRENLPTGTIDYLTEALSAVSGSAETAVYPTTVPASSLSQPMHDGTNVVAVEIHQDAPDSSDIWLELELIATLAPSSGAQPEIYWGQFDSDHLVLAWSDPSYTLWGADQVTGPWSQVSATSPMTVVPSTGHKFYQLRP